MEMKIMEMMASGVGSFAPCVQVSMEAERKLNIYPGSPA